MKTDLFRSCGHCWVFQIFWHIEYSIFTASSFRILNSCTGIPSPLLALLKVMLPMAHLTSHSRMSGSRWVITPLWLSGSWRSFLYSSSMYSCHLFLICSAPYKVLNKPSFNHTPHGPSKASLLVHAFHFWACWALHSSTSLRATPSTEASTVLSSPLSLHHPTLSPIKILVTSHACCYLLRHSPHPVGLYFISLLLSFWASLVAQLVKNLPAMWETWVWSLGWDDPLEKGKANHSSILAWRNLGHMRLSDFNSLRE